ncbi:MAG: DNA translocase FtsK [Oscillospiraceae bacterium]|nr:DNA translocase FtsK [Oscillospiraceae bacterium]
MAQTGKKNTSSASNQSGTANKSSRSQPVSSAARPPRRREIMAVVCFIIGVFSFIGYFDTEPVFIAFLTGFVKGLIGYGYFALPPALIMCSVILAFHKGRPILLRTICTLMVTIITGAVVHLFAVDEGIYELSFAMIGQLWTSGTEQTSGGVISGSISELFIWLFGKVGATVALLCAAGSLLLVAFNATISGLIEAFSKREKRQYAPYPEQEQNIKAGFEPVPEAVQQKYEQRKQRPYRHSLIPLWKKRKIDIKLDEENEPRKPDHFADDENDVFQKSESSAKISNQIPAGNDLDYDYTDADGQDIPKGTEQVDMPLDIPFMEGKGRERTSFMPLIREEKTSDYIPDQPPDSSLLSEPPEPKPSAPVQKQSKKPEAKMPVIPDIDPAYLFPPLDLLSKGEPQSKAGDSEVRQNTDRLETAFQSFGVNVKISNATRGPSVTRYEAELEAGVKLNKLTGLADDIALSLGTVGVRIAAMPNRISTVGIEVPNKNISKVHLRDVIESKQFSGAKSKLTFAIGMDITGEPIVGDVPKLPHMLVAGTTGSGKSVCLNSIILSILYKASPEDVRFIMIDPKMVEFKVYNSIPHLLVPVVTDVKKAAGALQWATYEMMKRYTLFAETSARDLEGYNQIARKSKEEREPLPQIIVVIDELADLMMMAAKEVEESVCRVAQMGRAAGIHLIIATQSPRADVITGLMKANIPSRIAFKVSSALESRIILDPGSSADKLVGHGDMLYAPTGSAKPMRLQGTWVSDKEREKVIEYIEKSGETQYSEEVMGEIEKASAEKSSGPQASGDAKDGEYDEMIPKAVDVIFETEQASVSMLQRRLKLGYARAARIMDQMEELGVVGPFEGSKPRNILITKDQWRQMQYTTGNAPADN